MDANKSISFRPVTEDDKREYFEMSRDFYASDVTNSIIDDNGREKFWKEIMLGEIVKGYFLIFGGETAG